MHRASVPVHQNLHTSTWQHQVFIQVATSDSPCIEGFNRRNIFCLPVFTCTVSQILKRNISRRKAHVNKHKCYLSALASSSFLAESKFMRHVSMLLKCITDILFFSRLIKINSDLLQHLDIGSSADLPWIELYPSPGLNSWLVKGQARGRVHSTRSSEPARIFPFQDRVWTAITCVRGSSSYPDDESA